MSGIRMSVVVPTYRRPELLERCLAALTAQDFDRDAYEIVVADDGAEERIRSQVGRWAEDSRGAPEIRYVPVTATQGPAGARNRGWREARGMVIAFTDDDTVPRPDWLTEGWNAMAQSGAVAAAGRVVVPLPSGKPTDYERDIARMEQAEFVTANCFVRRTALEAIGGFDERFTAAWREDSDLQFTLLGHQGEVVPAPRAVVEHPVRPVDDWTYGIRQHRKIAFDALLYKKHPDLYRQRIRGSPPWNYYGIVMALAGMLVGAAIRSPALALGAFALWAVLTGLFALRRLQGTRQSPGHAVEMLVTSAIIPVVAVFWRLAGAWRYRVFFL